ncbi:5-methylthioadenosine-S-adenosylhomocysteine deaminase protein [Salinisphaera shabanensis E1L3A]|uniref:5-methylthioadenosine/S-adenosylhomocysteine deaminase n=1 Tax=Salinisphaera shabanensis E1L3A TaxID=1033802 RepID=U2FRI8_9GAMM|nr:TRZ/ATZ family hydrolase [Salinisphaera shabanensis]ERJ18699.1 5-methylthioadenosine-S-adenosylhomocysteine deaminase protein [Salinisphaera shabanensis E1L3A]
MRQIDTLIHARWVAPISGGSRLLENHAVAIHHGMIEAVLPSEEACTRFDASEVIDRDTHLLIPGLINTHTHAAMNLMRGIADDLPLMPWLTEYIWPVESEFMSPEFVADGTDLAMAEMLRGGTTCFNDMYFFADVVAERVEAAGMRATVGMIVIDFPTVWAANADEYLEKGLALRDAWRGHDRISTVFAPHAPYTVSDAPLKKIRTYADEMDLRVHMHVHETAFEVADAQEKHGQRPLARLDDLGLLTPNFLAVHMTRLTDDEITLCARNGVHVLHSPESNLKLASGLCPVQRLIDAGINVALGTDGAASNNDLDMIGEMRTAAFIGKVAADDAGAVSADTVLRMATLGGAEALGIADTTGSIEPGKMADLCAIDLDALETQPVFDPIAALVYNVIREQVSDTWVAGQRLLADRQLTTIDEADIKARAIAWQHKLAAHSKDAS